MADFQQKTDLVGIFNERMFLTFDAMAWRLEEHGFILFS